MFPFFIRTREQVNQETVVHLPPNIGTKKASYLRQIVSLDHVVGNCPNHLRCSCCTRDDAQSSSGGSSSCYTALGKTFHVYLWQQNEDNKCDQTRIRVGSSSFEREKFLRSAGHHKMKGQPTPAHAHSTRSEQRKVQFVEAWQDFSVFHNNFFEWSLF